MTVSDLSLFGGLGSALDAVSNEIAQTQTELATGKRVNQPSDDPAAFAQGATLATQQAALSNDVALATAAQNTLATADNALANAANALDSAIQQATEGSSGTLSAAQMATLGQTVGGLLAQVISAANLQYGGTYVFGGNQVLTTPYSSTGNYNGDSGSNAAVLSDGSTLQLTFNGAAIFGNQTSGAIGALVALQSALNSGDQAGTAATLPQLQAAVAQIAQARAQIGATSSTAAAVVTTDNSDLTTLASAQNDAVGADLTQLAATEQLQLTQQQALVSLGQALGKLPLINILA